MSATEKNLELLLNNWAKLDPANQDVVAKAIRHSYNSMTQVEQRIVMQTLGRAVHPIGSTLRAILQPESKN